VELTADDEEDSDGKELNLQNARRSLVTNASLLNVDEV
jgi:hypothetical protein